MSSQFALPILGLRTHARRVKSLYKRSLRNLRCYYSRLIGYRIAAVELRDRFDQSRDIKDMREAKRVVEEGEKELFLWTHWCPLRFPQSYQGVAYQRHVQPPDWVVDYWHPLEKAQYPEYFELREKRKKEYVEWWDATYGDGPKKNGGEEEDYQVVGGAVVKRSKNKE